MREAEQPTGRDAGGARACVAAGLLLVLASLVADRAQGESSAETRRIRAGGSAGIVIAGIDLVMEDAYLVSEPDGVGRVEAPRPGQPVYFQGDWRTDGLGEPTQVALAATLDGVLFCQADLFTEPGELGVVYCNAPWIATGGTHTLRWEIDYFDQAAEIDELNNSAAIQFTTLHTPTRTRPPTATASLTRTPSASRSPTRTRTGTRTPTPTITPQPTSTRPPSATPVASATGVGGTPTRTPTAISASPTPTFVMSHAGFFARGDANCDVGFTAADVVATALAHDQGSVCGNDDCDRDGEVRTADLTCAAHCIFGACTRPPGAPQVTAVEAVSAAAIVPLALVRVVGTNLDAGERLPRAVIGGQEADVIEVVSGTEWLVVVPDVDTGPADVVLIIGDLDAAPFRITVAPAVPVGQPDTVAGTLDLVDAGIEQLLTLDFQALYGDSATVIRRALDDFRIDLALQRAALAADPAYTAEVRVRLDSALDASGAAEMLRAAVAQIGSAAVRHDGSAGAATVLARVVGQTTSLVGTVILRAAPFAGAGVLVPLGKIAAATVLVGGVVSVFADTPVITKVIPEYPRPGEMLEVDGAGFGSLPPLPALVVQTSYGEIDVPAQDASGSRLRFSFPSAPGICGPVRLTLTRLLRRSNSVPVTVQPILRGLSHTVVDPGEPFEILALGTTPCGSVVRFATSSLAADAPVEFFGAFGINTLRGRAPNGLPPGQREVFLQSSFAQSAETLPLQVANPIESLRIQCSSIALILAPESPTDAGCGVSPQPSGTVFPDGTRVTWTSSQPAVATVDTPGASGRFASVHAVGAGETTLHAEAYVDGTPRVVIGRSGEGLRIEVADRTPPCNVSIAAHPPGAPLAVDAGSSFRVRATAEDNFRVSFLEVSATGDAVGSPSPEDFGCPFEKSCTRTFRFDVRSAGFQSREVAVVARARDSGGNECTSAPLTFVVRGAPSATPAQSRTRTPTATRTRTPTPTHTVASPVAAWSRVGAPDIDVTNTIDGRTLNMGDGSGDYTREFGNWDVSFTWQAPQRIEAGKEVSFQITATINSWDALFGQVRAGFDVDAVAPGYVDIADATDLGGGPQAHHGNVTFTLPETAPDEIHLVIGVSDGGGSSGTVNYLYRRQ